MNHKRLKLFLAFLVAWSPCRLVTPSSEGAQPSIIVLKLHPTATAKGTQVTIGDIADLQGCSEPQRGRLARLDLADLPLSSQPIFISQPQIQFRLQLAGYDAGSFRLEGPRSVRVSRAAGEGLDAKIAVLAKRAVEEKVPGAVEDFSIQLAQNVSLPPLNADGGDIHLEAEIRSPILPPCRVAVEVAIYIRGARRNGVIVYIDVKKLQAVPVAVRRIDSGEAFSSDNVKMERVAVENPLKVVEEASLKGRRARHPIAAGRPIEPDDVGTDAPSAVVVHSNDLVHLIAKVGHLQVKTRGEALQSGRIGQMIQVRNLDSKATVTGRVVDGSTVEVEY
jgi:flagella basal body P-ring formation protein FlgA